MYHVALDLTPEQKRQLKLLAYKRSQTVTGYVTELVVQSLEKGGKVKKEENKT